MQKVLVLLSAIVLATVAQANYYVRIQNDAGNEGFKFEADDGTRACYCVSAVQTGSFQTINGGTVRLFSSSDCTGTYGSMANYGTEGNTQWVNSFSFGASGIPSSGPEGCPNWYRSTGPVKPARK